MEGESGSGSAKPVPLAVEAYLRDGGTPWRALVACAPTPEEVVALTAGQVLSPETLSYRTFRPEAGGLFDEATFGPFVDTGRAAPAANAEVDPFAFGRIRLPVPVLHPLFLRLAGDRVCRDTGESLAALEAMASGSEDHPIDAVERLVARFPALGVIEVVVLPVPLRPMRRIGDQRWATSDLNDLYRRVINRGHRTARLIELGAPEIIVRNERRMLHEAVASLFDNEARPRPVSGPEQRLSSLFAGFVRHGGFEAVDELDARVSRDAGALDGPLPFRLRAAAAHLLALGVDLRPRSATSMPVIAGGGVPVPY